MGGGRVPRLQGRVDGVGGAQGVLLVVGALEGQVSHALTDLEGQLFPPHASYNAGSTTVVQVGVLFAKLVDEFLCQLGGFPVMR